MNPVFSRLFSSPGVGNQGPVARTGGPEPKGRTRSFREPSPSKRWGGGAGFVVQNELFEALERTESARERGIAGSQAPFRGSVFNEVPHGLFKTLEFQFSRPGKFLNFNLSA